MGSEMCIRDRFLLKVVIDYPAVDTEREIMQQVRREALAEPLATALPADLPLDLETLHRARREVLECHMADPVQGYVAQLVDASRNPTNYSAELAGWIYYGASPRASLAFDRCGRALAWLDGRDYVSPEDVQQLAHEILRHRVLLTYQAEADGIGIDAVIERLLSLVPVA